MKKFVDFKIVTCICAAASILFFSVQTLWRFTCYLAHGDISIRTILSYLGISLGN